MLDLSGLPNSLQKLVRELTRLPAIGGKSALRLAYHLVCNDRAAIDGLVAALNQAKTSVLLCERCCFLSEERICKICQDSTRDDSILCIVEKPIDLLAIERSRDYKGRYHVLHGLWAPLRGKGPEQMKILELQSRLSEGKIKEAILALDSTVEGDATSLYLARLLNEKGVSTSRLAQGLPKGGELEFADDTTISHAFLGRRPITP